MENPDLTSTSQPPMPPPAPVNQPPPVPRPSLNLWLVAAVVVVAGIFVLIAVTATTVANRRQTPQLPTASLTPSPTPTRNLSPLATQSAFLKLEQAVASLSASIGSYSPQDPSLSPPTLDLPLGLP